MSFRTWVWYSGPSWQKDDSYKLPSDFCVPHEHHLCPTYTCTHTHTGGENKCKKSVLIVQYFLIATIVYSLFMNMFKTFYYLLLLLRMNTMYFHCFSPYSTILFLLRLAYHSFSPNPTNSNSCLLDIFKGIESSTIAWVNYQGHLQEEKWLFLY